MLKKIFDFFKFNLNLAIGWFLLCFVTAWCFWGWFWFFFNCLHDFPLRFLFESICYNFFYFLHKKCSSFFDLFFFLEYFFKILFIVKSFVFSLLGLFLFFSVFFVVGFWLEGLSHNKYYQSCFLLFLAWVSWRILYFYYTGWLVFKTLLFGLVCLFLFFLFLIYLKIYG